MSHGSDTDEKHVVELTLVQAERPRPPKNRLRSSGTRDSFRNGAALVSGLRNRDREAQAAFFALYGAYVARVATKVLGPHSDVADVVQQVFVDAFEAIDSLEHPAAMKRWMGRIAARRAMGALRAPLGKRWLRLFANDADEEHLEPRAASTKIELRIALRAVYQILDVMGERERLAFRLRFIEGLRIPDVARACDVSLATAKRRLKRAERRFLAHARRRPELEDWIRDSR